MNQLNKVLFLTIGTIALLLVKHSTVNAQFSPSPWRLKGVYYNNYVLNDSVAIFHHNSMQGLIHLNGDTLVKAKYATIKKLEKDHYLTFMSGYEMGVLNSKYQEVLKPIHYEVNILEKGIQGVIGKQILFYDFDGNLKQDSFYNTYFISQSENGLLVVSKDMKQYGVMDEKSKSWILKPSYNYINISNPNFILASNKDDYQIYNSIGIKLHKNSKQKIISWGDNFLVRATEHAPYFIYDKQGKKFEKMPKLYGSVYCEDNLYQISGQYNMVYDTNFNLLFEGEKIFKLYERPLGHLKFNYHTVEKKHNEALLIDYKLVTPYKYNNIETMDSLIIGVHDEGIDVLDRTGKLIKTISQNIAFFTGYKVICVSSVEKDSIYLFDRNQFLSVPKFKEIFTRSGLFGTRKDKIWYILDTDGNILISGDESLDNMDPNEKGFTYTKNKLKGWYAYDGFLLPEYNKILSLRNGLISALKDNLWGLFYTNGKEFSPLKFSKIEDYDFGVVCRTNDKCYVLPKGQKEFTECQDFQYIINNFVSIKNFDYWKIYNKNFKPINSSKYKTFSKNTSIIKADNEYFVINNNNDEVISHNFDTMYYQSDILIGRKKDTTSIFTAKANFKSFHCDSVGSINPFATIYKKGKISLVDLFSGVVFVQNADQIIEAEHPLNGKFIIVKKDDQYEVYCSGKKVLSLNDLDIKVEIKNAIISYNQDSKRFIYDAIQDSSYEKKHDLYKLEYLGNYVVENNFKSGLVNIDHQEIVPCKFDEYFSIINDNYIIVRDHYKNALYDLQGNLCIPLDDYDGSFTSNKNYIFAKKDNYYGYYDINEKKWFPSSKYQDIKDCNIRIDGIGNIFIFVEKGKYGLMNDQCNVVISPEYENIDLDNDKFILRNNDKNSVIFVDRNMEKTSDYKDFVSISFDNYWIGRTDNSFDLFYDDKFVQNFSGSDPSFLSYNYLKFETLNAGGKRKINIYDLKERKVMYSGDQNVQRVLTSDRLIAQSTNGGYYLTDFHDKPLTNQSFYDFKILKEKWIIINDNGNFGVIDYNGNLVIEPKYKNFSDNITNNINALSRNNNQIIDVYDKNLTFIKSLDYDFIGNFSHNLAPVRKGMKFGYVDTLFNVTIPLEYDFCHTFYYPPVTFVFKDKKLEFIDPSGKSALNPKNLSIEVNDMLNQIIAGGNYNKENYEKIVCEEYYVNISDKLIFRHNETQKYGLMNPFYDIVLAASYDEMIRLKAIFKYCFGFKVNDKWGILNADGTILYEPKFERLEYDYISKKIKVSNDGHSSLIDFPDN